MNQSHDLVNAPSAELTLGAAAAEAPAATMGEMVRRHVLPGGPVSEIEARAGP